MKTHAARLVLKVFLALLFFITSCSSPTLTPVSSSGSPLPTPVPKLTSGATHEPATVAVTATALTATLVTPVATTPMNSIAFSGVKGKLVFSQDTNGANLYEIGLLDLATGQIKILTSSPTPGDAEPKWSADGKFICFTSGRNATEGYAVYRMKDDGSNQTILANVAGHNTINNQCSVSPDGKEILFQSNRDGNLEIYVTSLDGKETRNLTKQVSNDLTPSWSPDGSKIIFASDRLRNEYQLFTMDRNGGSVSTLLDRPGTMNYAPKYSPNGKMIAFLSQSFSGDSPQIMVANSDGTDIHQVTNGFDIHNRVTWMDNTTIIYSSRTSNSLPWGIYMLSLATKVRTPLLLGKTSYTDADWVGN